MEQEKFISGYCRQLDQSRMVAVILEDGSVTEVDCCYGNCIHQPNCKVAAEIERLCGENHIICRSETGSNI